MTEKRKNNQFILYENMPVGSKVLWPGDQLTIKDVWLEDNWIYCTLLDEKQNLNVDFEICAFVGEASEKFLLLGLTPNIAIDDPVNGCIVSKLLSDNLLELVPERTIKTIFEKCQAVLKQDHKTKIESLKKVFGHIRDYEDPDSSK